MIRNYFVIATRNLRNSTLYSTINIAGLSIGIACCLILSLLVLDQLSFDRDHVHAKDIFRVVHRQADGHQTMNVAYTQGLLAPELTRNFTEIREATRVGILQENLLVDNKEPIYFAGHCHAAGVFHRQLLAPDISVSHIVVCRHLSTGCVLVAYAGVAYHSGSGHQGVGVESCGHTEARVMLLV